MNQAKSVIDEKAIFEKRIIALITFYLIDLDKSVFWKVMYFK